MKRDIEKYIKQLKRDARALEQSGDILNSELLKDIAKDLEKIVSKNDCLNKNHFVRGVI